MFGLLSHKAVKGIYFKYIVQHLPHACQCVLCYKRHAKAGNQLCAFDLKRVRK